MMLMALNMAVERALPHCTVANACCASQAKEYFLQDSVLIDLILLDINLPDMDGRQLLKHLKEAERTHEIPVIIFTSTDSRDVAIECEELGASCFVNKKSDPEYLIFSIRSALAKKHHRSAWTVDDVPPGSPLTLSRRQRELAALVIAGYSNKEIAKTIGISSSTVKNHLTKMMSCMNVSSRGKLAAKLQAKASGVLDDARRSSEKPAQRIWQNSRRRLTRGAATAKPNRSIMHRCGAPRPLRDAQPLHAVQTPIGSPCVDVR